MTATAAGKKLRPKVCATVGGTYHDILGIKQANHSLDGQNVDDSEFGVDWIQRIQALKDCKLTLGGGYRPGDATGQALIQSAFINDTDLFVKILFDGTNGYIQQMRPSKFGIDTTVEDKNNLSIDLEGTGAPTQVP